jgi:hypothetical protein
MNKKKVPILIAVILIGLAGVNQYAVYRIKGAITDSLRKDSVYPASIRSFQGILPIGRFWLSGMQFITRFGDQSVNWILPSATANLKTTSFLGGCWEIQGIDAPGVGWKVSLPKGKGVIEGILSLHGASSARPPKNFPGETLWCERAEVTLPYARGEFKGRSLNILNKTRLEVSPFTLKDGAPYLPFAFNLRAELDQSGEGACLVAKGKMTPLEKRTEADIQLAGAHPADVDRYLAAAADIDELRGLRAADWIADGSFSIRLVADALATKVKGELTIRFLGVHFGEKARQEEVSGQALEHVLQLFENRTDTVQLGPVPFVEDLTTPNDEAFPQIEKGLAAELLRAASGAALKSGAKNLLQGLFKK